MNPAANSLSLFEQKYREFQAIWQDCYIGYALGTLTEPGPAPEMAGRWFARHGEFRGFADARHVEALNVTPRCLHEVELGEGVAMLETVIVDAIAYGSHERLPAGEARRLAELFVASFDSPVILSNFRREQGYRGARFTTSSSVVATPGGYSLELLVCCLDHHKIGYWLSIENE